MLMVKNPPANIDIRDMGSTPESERSLGGGHSNPLQYSCLENPMDRRAWRATVHSLAKSRVWLKQLRMHMVALQCCVSFRCTAKWFKHTHTHTHTHILFHYMLLQNTQYNPLCYIVGPCWQSTLSTVVCIFNPELLIYPSLPPSLPLW